VHWDSSRQVARKAQLEQMPTSLCSAFGTVLECKKTVVLPRGGGFKEGSPQKRALWEEGFERSQG